MGLFNYAPHVRTRIRCVSRGTTIDVYAVIEFSNGKTWRTRPSTWSIYAHNDYCYKQVAESLRVNYVSSLNMPNVSCVKLSLYNAKTDEILLEI